MNRPLLRTCWTVDGSIRIGVVDDDPIFRAGIVHTLEASPNLAPVTEGATAADALKMAAGNTLDILILATEIRENSLEIARAIRQTDSKVKIVILTASDDAELVSDAIRAGALGYILKDVSKTDLIHAIECIYRGERHIAPALASRLLWRLITQGPTPSANGKSSDLIRLTSRERQVLGLLSEGLTNQEIALKLGISVLTIKQFTNLIYSKMGVRNRMEAVAALRKSQQRAPRRNHA
jgi:two-component system nitrate/nitrite response regulator NarL